MGISKVPEDNFQRVAIPSALTSTTPPLEGPNTGGETTYIELADTGQKGIGKGSFNKNPAIFRPPVAKVKKKVIQNEKGVKIEDDLSRLIETRRLLIKGNEMEEEAALNVMRELKEHSKDGYVKIAANALLKFWDEEIKPLLDEARNLKEGTKSLKAAEKLAGSQDITKKTKGINAIQNLSRGSEWKFVRIRAALALTLYGDASAKEEGSEILRNLSKDKNLKDHLQLYAAEALVTYGELNNDEMTIDEGKSVIRRLVADSENKYVCIMAAKAFILHGDEIEKDFGLNRLYDIARSGGVEEKFRVAWVLLECGDEEGKERGKEILFNLALSTSKGDLLWMALSLLRSKNKVMQKKGISMLYRWMTGQKPSNTSSVIFWVGNDLLFEEDEDLKKEGIAILRQVSVFASSGSLRIEAAVALLELEGEGKEIGIRILHDEASNLYDWRAAIPAAGLLIKLWGGNRVYGINALCNLASKTRDYEGRLKASLEVIKFWDECSGDCKEVVINSLDQIASNDKIKSTFDRIDAASALIKLGGDAREKGIDALRDTADSDNDHERLWAAEILVRLDEKDAKRTGVGVLFELANNDTKDKNVQDTAKKMLVQLGIDSNKKKKWYGVLYSQ